MRMNQKDKIGHQIFLPKPKVKGISISSTYIVFLTECKRQTLYIQIYLLGKNDITGF